MADLKISELNPLPSGLLDPADEWVIQRAAANNYRVSQAEIEVRMDQLYAPRTHVEDDSIHFPDAPSDGNQYARQNGSWAIVTGGGGPGGAVSSVFGRTGAVVATVGDYNSSQVTNLSGVSGTTVTNALNTLNAGKADATIDILDATAQLLTYAAGNYQKFEPGADDTWLHITRPGGIPTLSWDPITVSDSSITNAKLADMPANTLKGNATPVTAAPQDFEIENLVDIGIPAAGDRILVQKEGGDLGQVQVGNLPGGVGGGGIDPFITTHTWTIPGTFDNSVFVVPFFVGAGAYNLRLIKVVAELESGAFTNAKIQRDPGTGLVDIAGLTAITLTAGVKTVFIPLAGGGEPLVDEEELRFVFTDAFGGAANLRVAVYLSHQTAA